jgi:hypothetical protein
MEQYYYDEFKRYMDDVIDMCDDKNYSEIQRKLKQNWNKIDGDIDDVCSNKIGKFYTGYEESSNFLKKKNSNINIIPPEETCVNQIVLGLSEDISPYSNYNETTKTQTFLILADSDLTESDNNIFVRCASFRRLNQCKYPVRILLPKNKKDLFNKTNGRYRITILELLTLENIFEEEDKNFKIDSDDKLKNNLWIIKDDRLPYDVILIKNPYYDIDSSYGGKKYFRNYVKNRKNNKNKQTRKINKISKKSKKLYNIRKTKRK